MELMNRNALVTGGAVRLGRVLALALARSGVNVAIQYHASARDAETLRAQVNELGVRFAAIRADLSRAEAVGSTFTSAQEALGSIDILVNNAAIFLPGGWQDSTVADWDTQFAINLRAPFFLSQAFARGLNGSRGHIVNIADWRGVRPGVGHMAYTYAKAGLVAMTRSLAQAMAPDVQVNAIAPGAVLPPPGQGNEYLNSLAGQIPLRRHGTPDDVAEAMLYLLHSDFVTGELLYVTGGQEL